MRDSSQTLSALRQRVAGDWQSRGGGGHATFPSGHPSLDAYLEGGFKRGQLHEIFAEDAEDNGSAAGFAAMLAQCAARNGNGILWLRTVDAPRRGGRFNPAGFAELGGDPGALLMAVAPNDTALLRSAADALRCNGFGAVIVECWGSPAILDLTASRRLTLAADRMGVTAIMLRLNAREQPSTADTRWSVQSAPSVPLAANAPGYPALDLTLLRRRSGAAGKSWRVEWDRDQQSFRVPISNENTIGNNQPIQREGGQREGGFMQPAALRRIVVPIFASGQSKHNRELKRRA